MKVEIQGRFAYILDSTPGEIQELQRLLTWKESESEESLLFEINGSYFTFWGVVQYIINHNRVRFKIEVLNPPFYDTSIKGVPDDYLEGISFRDFQSKVITKSLIMRSGRNDIATGGGKTEIIAGLVKYLLETGDYPITIIAPSIFLADNLRIRFMKRGLSPEDIGVVHGGSKDTGKKVYIFVVNTLFRRVKDFVSQFSGIDEQISLEEKFQILSNKIGQDFYHQVLLESKAVFFDEAHHCKAPSYIDIAVSSHKAKYFIGFSGSFLEDVDNPLSNISDATIIGVFGNLISNVPMQFLRKKGFLAEPIVLNYKVSGGTQFYRSRYNKIYDKFIVDNQKRSIKIVSFAYNFIRYGLPTMILVDRKKHALDLFDQLRELDGVKPVIVFGGSEGWRVDDMGIVENFVVDLSVFTKDYENGVYNLVIASSVFDEGVDIPSVGALILAGAGKKRRPLIQRIGRAIRSKDLLNRTFIVNMFDNGHVFLNSQSETRLKMIQEDLSIRVIHDEYKFFNLVYYHSEKLKRYHESRKS